jgi:hypothetical protein
MRKWLCSMMIVLSSGALMAQKTDSLHGNLYFNVAERLLHTDGNLKIWRLRQYRFSSAGR